MMNTDARAERSRVASEISGLRSKLPELKVEYGRLLRLDDPAGADEVRHASMEVFDRIQQLERIQFMDELRMIGRCSTTRGMEVAERLLAAALGSQIGGCAYESMSADGSQCVVVHEGVVPMRR